MWRTRIFSVLVLAFLCSCALQPLNDEIPTLPESYPLDGVKLIAKDLALDQAEESYLQSEYKIGPDSRLLIRYEALLSKDPGTIVVDEKHGVTIGFWLKNPADQQRAIRALKLCPLTRNWMMLATWESAYPRSNRYRWSSPGGDFDSMGCVSPKSTAPSPSASPSPVVMRNTAGEVGISSTDGSAVVFEVNDWMEHYVRGGQNFGLILMASEDVVIQGDLTKSHSPILRFDRRSAAVNGSTWASPRQVSKLAPYLGAVR